MRKHFVIGSLILFLFFLRFLSAGTIELSPEEAYYWNYAMHPALSYFDHPPMVAWIIRAGTFLLGKTEMGVRLAGLFLTLGSTWLIYLLGKLWFSRKAGLWGALLFQITPVYFVYGVIITPDVPLIFFWLLTIYLISISLLEDNKRGWYLAGFSLGLGMLSKYTAIFLILSTFLFLLSVQRYRHWLLKKEPYMALLISAFVFSPVIFWNYQHQWASFTFQFVQRFAENGGHRIYDLWLFFITQMGAMFPTLLLALLLVLIISARFTIKRSNPKWQMCFSFALPILAFFALYSVRSLVKVNWTLPGYLPLLLAAYPAYRHIRFRTGGRLKLRGQKILLAHVYALPLFLSLALYHMAIGIPYVPINKWVVGWSELGKVVEAEKKAFETDTGAEIFLFGMFENYMASELAFYTEGHRDVFSENLLGEDALAFEYWAPRSLALGRNGIAVDTKSPRLELLRRHFLAVDEKIRRIPIIRGKRIVRHFYLVRCYGYLG